MDKILIYSNNGNILIVANAIDVDLLSEYYSLIRGYTIPEKDFSYDVTNLEMHLCYDDTKKSLSFLQTI